MISESLQKISFPPGGSAAAPVQMAQRVSSTGVAPLPSSALLRGQKSVTIQHQGEIYRLQLTKLGKLILTK